MKQTIRVAFLALIIVSISLTAPASASDHTDKVDIEPIIEARLIIDDVNEKVEFLDNNTLYVEPPDPIEIDPSKWRQNQDQYTESLKTKLSERREQAFHITVTEINQRALEAAGFKIIENPNEVDTPGEARKQANKIEEKYVPVDQRAQLAADALRETANVTESLHRLEELLPRIERRDWEEVNTTGLDWKVSYNDTDDEKEPKPDGDLQRLSKLNNETSSNTTENKTTIETDDTGDGDPGLPLPGFSAILGVTALTILGVKIRLQ